EIKIPHKLKRHLDYPIDKIFIRPYYSDIIKNGIMTSVSRFNLDTLKIDKEYKLGGEICKIIDNKPVIRVKIK
ncbi:MAG: hypothetical protein AAGH46_05275, partial [Bacteroidota bacterium]